MLTSWYMYMIHVHSTSVWQSQAALSARMLQHATVCCSMHVCDRMHVCHTGVTCDSMHYSIQQQQQQEQQEHQEQQEEQDGSPSHPRAYICMHARMLVFMLREHLRVCGSSC